MQRKFLEELGLEKEVIDKIMAENGSDIERTKTSLNEQITDLQSQLTTAKETLKSFEGVDVKDLQGKITQLQTDLTAKETEHQNKIADMEFKSTLSTAISSFGAKNEKSVIPFLDLEALKASKNQTEDIKTALTQVKTDNDYLFGSDEPIKNPVAPTSTTTNAGALDSMRAAMGLSAKE